MVWGMPLEHTKSDVTHCPLSTQVRRWCMAMFRLWQGSTVRGMPSEYDQSEVTHRPLSTQVRRRAWPWIDYGNGRRSEACH